MKTPQTLTFALMACISVCGNAYAQRPDTSSSQICDGQWPKRWWYFDLGKERQLVPGTQTTIDIFNKSAPPEPTTAYDPRRPLAFYDILRDHDVPRSQPRAARRAAGRFASKSEAEAAKKDVDDMHQPPNLMPIQTRTFSPQTSFSCRVVMTVKNEKVYHAADWMVETAGVLVFGANEPCNNGEITKTITAVSCDGEKVLFSDKLKVSCDYDVQTCVHPIGKDALVVEHVYTGEEGDTQMRVATWDIKKKKRVHNLNWGHDGGSDTELLSVQDHDNDGVVDLTFRQADSDKAHKVLRWNGKTFAPVKK